MSNIPEVTAAMGHYCNIPMEMGTGLWKACHPTMQF